ncbi:MAG: carbohydrate ABC transporter permease [Lachnospirales bacterium]
MNILKTNSLSKIIIFFIISIIGIIMIFPLAWMISASFKFESDVFTFPIEWIPSRSRGLENYKEVWLGRMPFALYYWNSIKTTCVSVFFSIIIGCLGAYGFSKIEFPGRDKLFLLYLTTMSLPEQVTLIPRFMLFTEIGLIDTHWSIILNSTFSVMSVFILRQAMIAIPNELSQASKIDGAGHLKTLFSIIMPVIKPSIATFVILKFVWTWNDYQNPLVFLTNSKLYTIQLGVKMFSDAFGSFYALTMAAAVSAIVPLIILFIIGQKYIISGITDGGIKG